ncbi:MAG TPA: methylated-DNA--[protein]-cysteine S-methyltransferase [Ktedonobacterales bacterium]|nr:methylated-DNA--[protein]-cysteine S-methyltransferase [Ktedonobacterales bacterium]
MLHADVTDHGKARQLASAAATTTIYYALSQTPIGPLHLFSTKRGLVKLALPNEPRSVAEAYVRRVVGPVILSEDKVYQAQALAELAAYFAGEGRAFSMALDLRGTPFQRLVWEAVAAVPYGETRTYGTIAQTIGRPAAVRAVGAANGANPLPIIIPCHRLIGANGSLIKYGGGLEVKRRLLALEKGSHERAMC